MKRWLFLLGLIVIVGPIASTAFASGLDSEGDELPMHANKTLVATLRNTTAGGLLDVANGVRIGSVGNDVDTSCVADQAGVVRYNSTSGSMQYCNGKTLRWSAAFSGGSDYGSFAAYCPSSTRSFEGSPLAISYEASGAVCVVTQRVYTDSPPAGTKLPAGCIPNPKTGKCNCPEGSTKTILSTDSSGYQYWLCQKLSD